MDDRTPSRLRDRIAVVAFVLVLGLPGVAFLLGARPPNVEGRVFAAMPALSVEALWDAETYAAIDRFVTDGFPLRAIAIALRGHLLVDVLGISSNGQVALGTDGWLYLTQELQPRCRVDAASLLAVHDAGTAALAERGVELWLTIPPDKRIIHPEHAPITVRPPCTDAEREALRTGMAERPGSTVDLWAPILTARRDGAAGLYTPDESHWTPAGAVLAAEAIVEAIAPGTWNADQVETRGTQRRTADLTRLLGTPRVEDIPRIVVTRDGGVAFERAGVADRSLPAWHFEGDDPVVPGTTLFITDSMLGTQRDLLAPWFERSIWLDLLGATRQLEQAGSLPPIDRVVIASTERQAYDVDLEAILEAIEGSL